MTPHNEAKKEEIAKTVLMPGDPERAKMIAENYLENVKLVNKVRDIYAYTGTYKGKEVTVMASGMGNPSMGIYSYELFKFYEVDKIIRIGSAGSYTHDLKLFDVALVERSFSETTYGKTQNGDERNILYSSAELNQRIMDTANKLQQEIKMITVHCSDVFYAKNENYEELLAKYNCQAVEMETFALFHNAEVLNKQAACLLTISDSFVSEEKATADERQNSFRKMIELALESIL